jgi:methylamine utilization protein MauE
MTPPIAVADADGLQLLATAAQLAVGGTFLAAAAPKLRRPGRFVATVTQYQLIPAAMAAPAAAVVMAGEVLVTVSFLSGRAPAAGVGLGVALLAAFAAGTWLNLKRGRAIECGCFGGSNEVISARSLARIGILTLGVLVFAIATTPGGTEALRVPFSDQPWVNASYLLGAAAVAVGAVIASLWAMELPRLRDILRAGADERPIDDHLLALEERAP